MVTGKAISALYQFLVSRLIEDQIDIAAYSEHDHLNIPSSHYYKHVVNYSHSKLKLHS
jgi:molybdopterin-guanine dinucleotide biosynthesis protein A